jgi:hypothetical protein
MDNEQSKFRYARVEIVWYDICNADGAWLTESEVLNHILAECVSVGFMFSKTRNTVKIFSSWSFNKDHSIDFADVVAIPAGCIKSITVI